MFNTNTTNVRSTGNFVQDLLGVRVKVKVGKAHHWSYEYRHKIGTIRAIHAYDNDLLCYVQLDDKNRMICLDLSRFFIVPEKE